MAEDKVQQSRVIRIGDMLVSAGAITGEQLRIALDAQRRTGGARLGQVLVALGYLTENDLAQTVARVARLEFNAGPLAADPDVSHLVTLDQARRWRTLPVRREDGAVVVACADPFDMLALEDVRLAVGETVLPVVVTERDLEQAIAQAFGTVTPTTEVVRLAEGTIVQLLDDLIARAVREQASDMHVEPMADGVRVRLRVDGVLIEISRLDGSMQAGLLSRVKVLAGLDIADHRAAQDGRAELEVQGHRVDVRISILPTIHGEKAVLRLLDRSQHLQSIEELGMDAHALERYRRMIHRPHGLVLATGPTGSGKTTTLMAALTALNRPERNIITLEDPVEYRIAGVNQVQVGVKLGFADGLRAIVRQDPDIVMVGEIRDAETAELAVRAALTGHLVLTSVHTNSAAATAGRLVDMGVEPFLVASSLSGIVAQRLLRRLCSRCRQARRPTEEETTLFLGLSANDTVYEPGSCAHCRHTGYRGRTGVFEVLPATPAVRELIARRARADELAGVARTQGMQSLLENGVAKVRAGATSLDEVRRAVYTEETET